MFFIKQLEGLKDPTDPAFKRYSYLLENLVCVKSFGMISNLEDCKEIFTSLFRLLFEIVNKDHSVKVKTFMLDLLCNLITDYIVIDELHELLDIVLENLLHPIMTKRKVKNAYNLAKELVMKTSDTLEPFINQFFERAFDHNKSNSIWYKDTLNSSTHLLLLLYYKIKRSRNILPRPQKLLYLYEIF